jgi:hypothetical protein
VYFFFFMDLKDASSFGWSLSVPVLISYAIRDPCNSSIVILVKSLVSSMVETLASYFKRSDLNTFCTTKDSSSSSPNPLIELTTSSTLIK